LSSLQEKPPEEQSPQVMGTPQHFKRTLHSLDAVHASP
jgi:hypothetical protein